MAKSELNQLHLLCSEDYAYAATLLLAAIPLQRIDIWTLLLSSCFAQPAHLPAAVMWSSLALQSLSQRSNTLLHIDEYELKLSLAESRLYLAT